MVRMMGWRGRRVVRRVWRAGRTGRRKGETSLATARAYSVPPPRTLLLEKNHEQSFVGNKFSTPTHPPPFPSPAPTHRRRLKKKHPKLQRLPSSPTTPPPHTLNAPPVVPLQWPPTARLSHFPPLFCRWWCGGMQCGAVRCYSMRQALGALLLEPRYLSMAPDTGLVDLTAEETDLSVRELVRLDMEKCLSYA